MNNSSSLKERSVVRGGKEQGRQVIRCRWSLISLNRSEDFSTEFLPAVVWIRRDTRVSLILATRVSPPVQGSHTV